MYLYFFFIALVFTIIYDLSPNKAHVCDSTAIFELGRYYIFIWCKMVLILIIKKLSVLDHWVLDPE